MYHINYEIDTYNIWEFEKHMYFKGQSSDLHAKKVLDVINSTIARYSSPTKKYKEISSDAKIGYLLANLKGTEGLLKMNSFVYNKNEYIYSNTILVNRSEKSFEFLFMLKLRQYINHVSSVAFFLDYQLEQNFENNLPSLTKFLSINSKRHREEFFTNDLIKAINLWIQSIKTSNDNSKINNRRQEKPERICIKINQDYHLPIIEALAPFFDSSEHEQLAKLIQGEIIDRKLYFQSNANRFSTIFRQLHLHQKVISNYTETKEWICNYFRYNNSKKGQTDFVKSDVHKVLTDRSYDLPKSKRINITGLEFIKDKS